MHNVTKETSIGPVWYDPEPERALGRWPDQDRERLALHIARSVARAIGNIPGRVVVRTYSERIWVTAAPYDGGLPSRGAHGGDEPTRAGLTIRIEPPTSDLRGGRAEYRALAELRSWFQRPGLDHPIPFALHMAHAMRAMRALGLVPRVDAETSDECRYDVRMAVPAADVSTLVSSYLAVPFRQVACDDDPRVEAAADIEHCHAIRRKARKRVRGIIEA